jgi:protein-tyrosine phosphatase
VIDLHSHLLPGIDDGPDTLAGSLAIARAMVDDGVRRVAATPHVRDDWPTRPEEMEVGVEALRAELEDAGLALDVLPGGEIALEALDWLAPEERARFGLGGNPSLLLVEFPYWGWPLDLEAAVTRLVDEGVVPVIAHPERNEEVWYAPQRLAGAVRAGAVCQLTAASVDGRLGEAARDCSRRLLELGLAHLVASDAHTAAIRAAGMGRAAGAIGDPELARWLTEDVPGALLDGRPLPSRPEGRRKRRWGLPV